MSPPVVRVMRILDYLALHASEEFTLSEIARRLELTKATCHAILNSLADRGYATRNDLDGRFQLGPALIPLGHVAQSRFRPLDIAEPALRALAEEAEVSVAVSIRTDSEIVQIARFGPESVFSYIGRPGMRLPLVPPLGTTFFAWEDPSEVEAWLSTVKTDEKNLVEYRAALARARERGYVAGRDLPTWRALNLTVGTTQADSDVVRPILEERIEAVRVESYVRDSFTDADPPSFLAAPVFGRRGRITLAVSVLLGTNSIPASELARRLVQLTTQMTLASGGAFPR